MATHEKWLHCGVCVGVSWRQLLKGLEYQAEEFSLQANGKTTGGTD